MEQQLMMLAEQADALLRRSRGFALPSSDGAAICWRRTRALTAL